jgi:hypothetical protein
MACHEIAALRLGLMRVIGVDDEAERQHELAELGDAAEKPGAIRSLCDVRDVKNLQRLFGTAVADLEEKVSRARSDDPKLPYLRTLVVLSKKTELELKAHSDDLMRFYRELEEMHDFVHEIYPAE